MNGENLIRVSLLSNSDPIYFPRALSAWYPQATTMKAMEIGPTREGS